MKQAELIPGYDPLLEAILAHDRTLHYCRDCKKLVPDKGSIGLKCEAGKHEWMCCGLNVSHHCSEYREKRKAPAGASSGQF